MRERDVAWVFDGQAASNDHGIDQPEHRPVSVHVPRPISIGFDPLLGEVVDVGGEGSALPAVSSPQTPRPRNRHRIKPLAQARAPATVAKVHVVARGAWRRRSGGDSSPGTKGLELLEPALEHRPEVTPVRGMSFPSAASVSPRARSALASRSVPRTLRACWR